MGRSHTKPVAQKGRSEENNYSRLLSPPAFHSRPEPLLPNLNLKPRGREPGHRHPQRSASQDTAGRGRTETTCRETNGASLRRALLFFPDNRS